MSYLDNLQQYWNSDVKQEPEDKSIELLQANAELIDQLKTVQNDRLSAPPPTHFSQIQKPGEKEMELATNIQTNLVEMVGQVKPNNVVPDAAIRAVMGIKTPINVAGSESSPMDVE